MTAPGVPGTKGFPEERMTFHMQVLASPAFFLFHVLKDIPLIY